MERCVGVKKTRRTPIILPSSKFTVNTSCGPCLYCGRKSEGHPEELLACELCRRPLHMGCLPRGQPYSSLLGDNLFKVTCSVCSHDGREHVERPDLSSFQVLLLILYNLHELHDESSRENFFHWKIHISRLFSEIWEELQGPDVPDRRKKVLQNSMSGQLSHFTKYFTSGLSTFGTGGWYRLVRVVPPAQALVGRVTKPGPKPAKGGEEHGAKKSSQAFMEISTPPPQPHRIKSEPRVYVEDWSQHPSTSTSTSIWYTKSDFLTPHSLPPKELLDGDRTEDEEGGGGGGGEGEGEKGVMGHKTLAGIKQEVKIEEEDLDFCGFEEELQEEELECDIGGFEEEEEEGVSEDAEEEEEEEEPVNIRVKRERMEEEEEVDCRSGDYDDPATIKLKIERQEAEREMLAYTEEIGAEEEDVECNVEEEVEVVYSRLKRKQEEEDQEIKKKKKKKKQREMLAYTEEIGAEEDVECKVEEEEEEAMYIRLKREKEEEEEKEEILAHIEELAPEEEEEECNVVDEEEDEEPMHIRLKREKEEEEEEEILAHIEELAPEEEEEEYSVEEEEEESLHIRLTRENQEEERKRKGREGRGFPKYPSLFPSSSSSIPPVLHTPIPSTSPSKSLRHMSYYEELELLKCLDQRAIAAAAGACPLPPHLYRLRRKLAVRKQKVEHSLPLFNLHDEMDFWQKHGRMRSRKERMEHQGMIGRAIHPSTSKPSTTAPCILDRFQVPKHHKEHKEEHNISFAARLGGGNAPPTPIHSPYTLRTLKPYIYRDYSSTPLKLRLLQEIVSYHHRGEEGWSAPPPHPIDYCYVTTRHIAAMNQLAQDFFWPGIDLSEVLLYPDHTCVVLYRHLVLGFGVLVPDTSYNEAYLSFLLVHPEWRQAGIATFILYHLIQTCQGKDITLHVSATNPALILYQRFGFKVEEFLSNFYDKYLPHDSPECKHAMFMRLSR